MHPAIYVVLYFLHAFWWLVVGGWWLVVSG